MALNPQSSKPKWTDPNAIWKDDDAPPLMDMMRSEADVDRFHNHEDQSPEAMAKAITDLKATVDTLGGRLAAVEEGTSGVVHAAKDLGSNMVKMGDALTKRVKDLEGDAERATAEANAAKAESASAKAALATERKAREKTVRMTLIGGAAVVAALAALTLFGPRLGAEKPASAAPVLYSPNAPAN